MTRFFSAFDLVFLLIALPSQSLTRLSRQSTDFLDLRAPSHISRLFTSCALVCMLYSSSHLQRIP